MGRRTATALPSGAISVGIGLALLGITSYAFLTVAARQLEPADFASVSVLWSVVYIAGPGLFQPFEQQIGRSLSALRAHGDARMGSLHHAVVVAGCLLLGLCALTAVAAVPVTRSLFGGSFVVFTALLLSFVALAAAYVYRGVIAGQSRFDLYGLQLGTEGVVRFLGCTALALMGTHLIGPFALLIPLALVVSVLVSLRPRLLHAVDLPAATTTGVTGSTSVAAAAGGPADAGDLGTTLAWLVAAAALSQTLVNAATVLVKVLGRDDPAAAGHLLGGLMVARLPLFMFAAVQAALLPGLSALVALGRFAALRKRVLLLCLGIAAGMAVAAVLIGLAGPWAVRFLFGPRFDLSGGVLAAMTAGTGFYMIAVVLASAVMAVGRFRAVAACWAGGLLAMLVVTALPGSVVARVVAGFVIGAAVSSAALGATFGRVAPLIGSPERDASTAPAGSLGPA
jgi:O-antigen/teichoic acid export membrane protein